MKNIIRLLTVAFLIASVTEVRAEKNPTSGNQQYRSLKQTTAGCTPSSTFAWLNINNARVRVNAGGDIFRAAQAQSTTFLPTVQQHHCMLVHCGLQVWTSTTS